MSFKEKLIAAKKFFFAKENFEAYKLKDGSEISSSLEVGSEVTKDGAVVADGSYELEDGTMITVAEGKISEVKKPEVYESAKLKDGSELQISKLEVGGSVTKDGQPVPAGSYELEDGSTLVIGDGSVITEIKAAMPAVEPMSEIKTPEQMKAALETFATGTPEEKMALIEKLIKALMDYNFGWMIQEQERKDAIEVYKNNFNKQVDANKKQLEKFEKTLSQMFEIVEEMANTTITEPIERPRQRQVNHSEENREAQLKRYGSAVRKLSKEIN